MAEPYLHTDLLRTRTPLVQCLTNNVVMEITANALLAAGASPTMADFPGEAGPFARIASAVLVNTGTPSADKYVGMREAVRSANELGKPWVLDPIGAGFPTVNGDFTAEMAAAAPAVIKGNASEIGALAGLTGAAHGTDATVEVDSVLPAAAQLARRTGAVIAVTGARDLIVSDDRATWLTSGVPMLQQVIGTGCSLGAVIAAYASLAVDRHDAVIAGLAHFGAAAQVAAETARGPGSFAVAWLDALAAVDPERIRTLVATEEVRP